MNCPKCGYVRRLGTKVPEGQCPFCGIIYAQYTGAPRAAVTIEPEKRSDAGGSLSLVIAILIVSGLASFFVKPEWLGGMPGGEAPVAKSAVPVAPVKAVVQVAAAPKSAEAPQRGIIMYSLTTCGYCKRMRQKFEANNIPFTEYFVDVDKPRFYELTQKLQAAGYMGGGIGTPTLEVNGRMMPNNPPFEEVLRQARS